MAELSRESRLWVADEIVRRIDTVTLCRVDEVRDIRARALNGEFDDMATGLVQDQAAQVGVSGA